VRVFVDNVSLQEAQATVRRALAAAGLDRPLGAEMVGLEAAAGRVLAEEVGACFSVPPYHAAAMDGYAVRAAATSGASESGPLRLPLPDAAVPVDTGSPLPPGCDAVVMLEDAVRDGEAISITAAVPRWQHVRTTGEDVVAGELLFTRNHRLRPADLAVLASAGVRQVRVWRRPRVAVIPTGDELVRLSEVGPAGPAPGHTIESNSYLLAGLAREWGAEPLVFPPVPDRQRELEDVVARTAAEVDLVVVNAGSSAGSRDLTARVAQSLGKVLVHGVAVRPGKPLLFALVRSGERLVPLLGIPGYPVSAWLTFHLFGRPIILSWQGLVPTAREETGAVLTRRLPKLAGFTEFVRVRLARVGDRVVAVPLSRGAGVLTSLVQAEGLLEMEPAREGLDAGEEVRVGLLVERDRLEGTVLAVGSHDLALDVLAGYLRGIHPGITLASARAGSLAGLAALRRGEAHLAGIHLLDPATGEYNLPYVARYLPGTRVLLVTLALREQGIMVAPGNPLGIMGLPDLARPGVTMVNRQRGSGTRVLLDVELGRLGLDPERLQGYEREEYSHLAVAAAVAGGTADAGLGIFAAARALGLDFVPLATERYELAIPEKNLDHTGVRLLLEVVEDQSFRTAVQALGGYDTSLTAARRWVEGGRQDG